MIQFTPIESELETPEQQAAYEAWFRAKVEKAMASKEPCVPHNQVMAMARAIIDRKRPK